MPAANKRVRGTPQHGTYSGYKRLACRCDLCKSANNEYMREWRRRNPAKAKQNDKVARMRNPERVRQYNADWYANNRERSTQHGHAYRARKRGAKVYRFTEQDWAAWKRHMNLLGAVYPPPETPAS
jgi:hypothetical protein